MEVICPNIDKCNDYECYHRVPHEYEESICKPSTLNPPNASLCGFNCEPTFIGLVKQAIGEKKKC